jgi:hypothetical protein
LVPAEQEVSPAAPSPQVARRARTRVGTVPRRGIDGMLAAGGGANTRNAGSQFKLLRCARHLAQGPARDLTSGQAGSDLTIRTSALIPVSSSWWSLRPSRVSCIRRTIGRSGSPGGRPWNVPPPAHPAAGPDRRSAVAACAPCRRPGQRGRARADGYQRRQRHPGQAAKPGDQESCRGAGDNDDPPSDRAAHAASVRSGHPNRIRQRSQLGVSIVPPS